MLEKGTVRAHCLNGACQLMFLELNLIWVCDMSVQAQAHLLYRYEEEYKYESNLLWTRRNADTVCRWAEWAPLGGGRWGVRFVYLGGTAW